MRYVLAFLVVPLLALAGCGGTAQPVGAPANQRATEPTAGPTAASAGPASNVVDPLSEITDPASAAFLALSITPIVDRHGVGPTSFPIHLPRGVHSVRAYVACSPGSRFEVRIGRRFAGGCERRFTSFADIPMGTARRLELTIPGHTSYALVVIPSPSPRTKH